MTPDKNFRPDIPSTARMYDYFLGGKDNYPVDREAGERAIAMMPPGTVRTAATQNRKFLIRVVRYLTRDLGIRQFLDIGTGLPTMNNVHQVARNIDEDVRVVYIDHDPVVLAHARDMLTGVPHTTIIEHDLRDPAGILADAELRDTLDFSQPVAVLLVAILHFISDDSNPRGIITSLMDAVPSGSYLAISHATTDSYSEWDNVTEVYAGATSSLHNRSHDQVTALFEGYELVDPGKVVWLPEWHPDSETGLADNPGESLCWCGVARKP
jgi:hypothetical protein